MIKKFLGIFYEETPTPPPPLKSLTLTKQLTDAFFKWKDSQESFTFDEIFIAGFHHRDSEVQMNYDSLRERDKTILELEEKNSIKIELFRQKDKTICSLQEEVKLLEDALKYYSESPAFKESNHIVISSNFKSNSYADLTLEKLQQLRSNKKDT